jgi:hypothetical protein
MRSRVAGKVLIVRAIAGSFVVILAWDFRSGKRSKAKGLLGFAIERSELGADGTVEERYWLSGIKRFRDKDAGLPPGTPVSSAEHPIQGFQWGDYTAKSGRKYLYRVVPVYGKPKLLELGHASATAVEASTEREAGSGGAAAKHDIHFNRGVIGSQAFARRFPEVEDLDPERPDSAPLVWLSRGLYEALLAFIGRAKNEDFALRAALYEFHYAPVARAFARAVDAGADVRIVYDAQSNYKTENEATIAAAGLLQAGVVIPRTVSEGIRHNKFIVLLEDGQPVAVWTGSTNISAGGIFGHSNVGHVVWDGSVAKAYLDYRTRLSRNLTPTQLRGPNLAATPTPAGKPPPPKASRRFSARATATRRSARCAGTLIAWPRRKRSPASRWPSTSTRFSRR